ncbi:MAG: 4-hydroxy-3-methylbut-2-enyl diphosphate reductase [Actinobacteria bacterium]|nr:4-hydroxy-3-methylbut-2-enyl diphosphate reductase [Actinomycetota bacterium]MBU4392405.1 4-hydroxy-3-methylbut-2-enyl diphosphate reductase [Actinomycetota bacterium]MBU4403026.1 4-hydroxy-3-methylbut-2-enyl diphosphate reductase [Actinomycetota bacterium]MBU4442706.1 4-hydroxy-3-methylbut-2-enyl diphosphate reductase [Actinomycetota bacterium]
MEVKIKVTGGHSFCPGVDRAIRITEDALTEKGNTTYSTGPLIHNPEVVSRLEMLGLKVLDPAGDHPDVNGANVIIRSHGIDIETEDKFRLQGAVLVDATCPTVKWAQEAARELAESGCRVIVLGSESHPEVRSIVGRAGAPVTVIQNTDDAHRWADDEGHRGSRVGIVCQTTVSRNLLDSVTPIIEACAGRVEVRDTICESVTRRRRESVELARSVDLMIVVGGRNSSNTTHLAEICREAGVTTRHIEDSSEIQAEWLSEVESVGVTGGASTPDWQIDETVARLEEITGA